MTNWILLSLVLVFAPQSLSCQQKEHFYADEFTSAFIGLHPSAVISRCGRPLEDKTGNSSLLQTAKVRLLRYPTQRYGPVVVRFISLSPTPADDNLAFAGLTRGNQELLPAKGDGKLIIDILPCLVAAATPAGMSGSGEQQTAGSSAWDIASAMKSVYGAYDTSSKTAFWSDFNPPKSFYFDSEHGGTVQLVLDVPFVDGATHKRFVVTATSPAGEDFSCHGCSPLLGAFVFAHFQNGWAIESQERFLLLAGGYGKAPTTELVRLKDGHYGVKFTDTSTNQGETSTSTSIAEPVGSNIVIRPKVLK
jgi:hypothetical protein